MCEITLVNAFCRDTQCTQIAKYDCIVVPVDSQKAFSMKIRTGHSESRAGCVIGVLMYMQKYLDIQNKCIYKYYMKTAITWDENKRQSNIKKHGLDFADAGWVLDFRYRFDITVIRNGEERTQSFAYVFGKLAALLVVHTERAGSVRIISFRYASEAESRAYYEWVENEFEDTE